MLRDALFIIAGLIVLYSGGVALVRGAESIGRILKLSNLVTGLTLVAFGTSAPELAVSVDAGLTGRPDIAIANVIGSNLANIGLVAGIIAIIGRGQFELSMMRKDVAVMLVSFLAIFVCMLDGVIAFHEGIVLVTGLIAYTIWLLRVRRSNFVVQPDKGQEIWSVPLSIALLLLGVILLAIGADMLVAGSVSLAKGIGVSEAYIGLTVVAVGTSLPEITASVVAARRSLPGMAIGNVIGSNLWNSFGVLGLTASFTPLIANTVEWHMLIALLGFGLLFFYMIYRGRFGIVQGVILLLGYFSYQIFAGISG